MAGYRDDASRKTSTGGVTRRGVLRGTAAGAAALAVGGLGYVALTRPDPRLLPSRRVDVAIIGGGIMGGTLGAMLKQLQPGWTMEMFERLDAVAQESSAVWHNAGTGHSALCEPNYTPMVDGAIQTERAIAINEQFQVTRQFLASMVRMGEMSRPRAFLNAVPHMAFGIGEDMVAFQRARQAALIGHPLFAGMEFSADRARIAEWAPLLVEDRDPAEAIGASWSNLGTDANWGEVAEQLIASFVDHDTTRLHLSTQVEDLSRNPDGSWRVVYAARRGDTAPRAIDARHVFVGTGGAALLLLQRSGIPEAANYAGFPVGGAFIVNERPEIAGRHLAKTYGRAGVGDPPMSVPHLDTRFVDGVPRLAFGPFATFSTDFLMEGSSLDLFRSITTDNLGSMVDVGTSNLDLVRYLVGQVLQTDAARLDALRSYYPAVEPEGWDFVQAGQRVQIIKRNPGGGATLEFGTEVVTSEDGTIAALLGASPGASTAPSIILETLERMFPDEFRSARWRGVLTDLIPSYGQPLNTNIDALREAWAYSSDYLELPPPPTLA